MAKKEKKKKKPMQVWTLYEAKSDKIERKNKQCPKCGPGYFMALHKDRITCGNCRYTEFTGEKTRERPSETQGTKPEEKAPEKEEKKEPEKPETEKEKSEVKSEKKEESKQETK